MAQMVVAGVAHDPEKPRLKDANRFQARQSVDHLHEDLLAQVLPVRVIANQRDHNATDAALATPLQGVEPQHFALRLGEVTGIGQPTALLTRVKKSGATSHVTEGEITDFNATFRIDYDAVRSATFDGWVIEPVGGPQAFSRPGDSGALVVDTENSAVAMVIGGCARFLMA